MAFRIKDKVWVQQSFLLPEEMIDENVQLRRTASTAAFKFTDTTIGGNFAINAPPQFTRFADIRMGGSAKRMHGASNLNGPGASGIRWMRSTGRWFTESNPNGDSYTTPSAGMGHFYSEGIDDHGQDLVMRFGVPEYNSLVQFFGNFYSSDASMMARTGRSTSLFATAARAVGFLIALPLQPIILGGQWLKFMGYWPSSKYYYMKPTMYPYWSAVNTIVNGIAVNIGLIPHELTPTQKKTFGIDGVALDDPQTHLQEYAKVLPDVFLGAHQLGKQNSMGLDVFAIATRAQRIANKYNEQIINKLDDLRAAGDLNAAIKELRDKFFVEGQLQEVPSRGIEAYRDEYFSSERNNPSGANYLDIEGLRAEDAEESLTADGGNNQNHLDHESANPDGTRPWYNWGDTDSPQHGNSWFGSLGSMFHGERRDGGMFVTFRVSYSGSTGESFSSSVEESQISQKFNSSVSSARQARFSWADGNLGVPVLDQVISAAKGVVSNVLEGASMSGLVALAGNAFVDIPKTWSGSTAQLPRAEYTIKLRSPYGTRMSRMMNIYIPLAMLLAGALPLSTGKRSYTAPFICEAFCRGRHAIRLGMIDSLSITRGTGNMGWNMDGDALGVDVTFSIVDLSTIMHLPITSNFTGADKAIMATGDVVGSALGHPVEGQEIASYFAKGTYDDDNAFTDYLAVLGSLSWQDMIYANRRWRLARYRQMQNWNTWKSPARVSSAIGHTQVGRMINAISVESDRPD